MKVAIATPFYEVKGYSPYIVSLLDSVRVLQEIGLEWDFYELSGDSYVDRAKNSLVHRFMESDFTHVFMVDSDMVWEPQGFAKLLKAAMAGAQVVGGAYPCKNMWDYFGCLPKIDKDSGMLLGKEEAGMRLLDMYCLPGGFLLYSRQAFERTRPRLKTYHDGVNNLTFTEYFRCNIEENGVRVGEDVYFQLRYKESGGVIWCEPDINIRHIGVRAWEGNYHQQLLTGQGTTEINPMSARIFISGEPCELP